MNNTSIDTIQDIVRRQKEFYRSGVTRDIKFRKSMLRKMQNGLIKWEKSLCDALWKDLHKCYEEAYMTEIGLVYGEISDALSHVSGWGRRRRACTPLTVQPAGSLSGTLSLWLPGIILCSSS